MTMKIGAARIKIKWMHIAKGVWINTGGSFKRKKGVRTGNPIVVGERARLRVMRRIGGLPNRTFSGKILFPDRTFVTQQQIIM